MILLRRVGESGTVVIRAMHIPLASRTITTKTERTDIVQTNEWFGDSSREQTFVRQGPQRLQKPHKVVEDRG